MHWQRGGWRCWLAACNTKSLNPPCAQVWHPNLDLQGNVCLSILRKDWKPVYTLEDVVIGLEFLMKNPDGDDPLNLEAGKEFRENTALFESNVAKSIAGRTVNGHSFSRLSLD